MAAAFPSISTDQLAALVELARAGSIREAAEELLITEQGLRNRLLALEQRLGVALYHKRRGIRRGEVLTPEGKRLLPHARSLLDRARELAELFAAAPAAREIHVAASQYLAYYVLIDAVRRFHRKFPDIRVRLSTRTEQAIEETLLNDPDVALGIAAPYELPAELEYRHLFSLDWSFVAPRNHRLLGKKYLRLADLADEPLILFERGSTGRRHVIDAFHTAGVSPRVEMEVTNTQTIVRMVEGGLGASVLPLLASGAVTRGLRIGVRSLGQQIAPINSGILTRRNESLPLAARRFVDFVCEDWRKER